MTTELTELEVGQKNSEQPMPELQDPDFSGLEHTAPGFTKELKAFWPYYKNVLAPQTWADTASIRLLKSFLERLDISVGSITDATKAIQESWRSARTTPSFQGHDLARNHKGDLHHTNTLATKALRYEAGLCWSKVLSSAGFYVYSLNPMSKTARQIPALLMRELKKLDISLRSLQLKIDMETSWTPKRFAAETEIGMLKELSLCVTGKKKEIDTKGRPCHPQLGVQADNHEIFVSFYYKYRDCLPEIIKVLNPDYVEVSLSEEDRNMWIASSGFFRRLILKAKLRPKFNHESPLTREHTGKYYIPDFEASVPISWVRDFEKATGKSMLDGYVDGQTYVMAVKKGYEKMGDNLDVLKSIASIAAEVMPWRQFSITGKTTRMNANNFFGNNSPTQATITKFDLDEKGEQSRNSISSEFMRLEMHPGRFEHSVIFSTWIYPEKSILQEFQEEILRKLGVAAAEDIPATKEAKSA